MKTCLITGATGQDGSYLIELLLSKGYQVHGIIRRASTFNTERIEHLFSNENLQLHYGDLTDSSNLNRLLKKIQPEEIYNLAAQSHVKISFEVPEYTAETNSLGTLRLLDAIRDTGIDTKFYQASTSEMFGDYKNVPMKETDFMHPKSPYAVSKLYAYWITINYRESYGMQTYNGILFNHESPRRGERFVTRKITKGIAKIKNGTEDKIHLGNIDAMRDWGYAPEYVEAMWMMMQKSKPDDFVIATGEVHSVREFAEESFRYAGYDEYEHLIEIDKKHFRPLDTNYLCGDASKAKRVFGWEPKTKFNRLVEIMMEYDLNE